MHAPDPAPDLVCIGKIVGCFGIKGHVKVQTYTHTPDRFRKLKAVFLGRTDTDVTPAEIEQALLRERHVQVKFRSIDDRTEAGKLNGLYLFVTKDDVARPPKGEWFIDDIIGCTVTTEEGVDVGRVEDVLKFGGPDLWVVRTGASTSVIPAVPEFIRDVNIGKKRIVIHAIEGLLDQS